MPGWRDPIAAGFDLVRDHLQSLGFVTGVSGWRGSRDGDFELNSATVRGGITVTGDEGVELPLAHVGGMLPFIPAAGRVHWEETGAGEPVIQGFHDVNTGEYWVQLAPSVLVAGDLATAAGGGVAGDLTVAGEVVTVDGRRTAQVVYLGRFTDTTDGNAYFTRAHGLDGVPDAITLAMELPYTGVPANDIPAAWPTNPVHSATHWRTRLFNIVGGGMNNKTITYRAYALING